MDKIFYSESFQWQNSGCQVRSQNLWISVLDEFLFKRSFSVESETFTRFCPTSPTSSLFSTGFADGRNQQTFDSHSRIEDFLFRESRVNHIDNTIDCNTCFCDICCHDYFTTFYTFLVGTWRGLENPLLLVRRQGRVQRYHSHRANFVSKLFDAFLYFGAGEFNFFFSC